MSRREMHAVVKMDKQLVGKLTDWAMARSVKLNKTGKKFLKRKVHALGFRSSCAS
jgi:hypothetical protein